MSATRPKTTYLVAEDDPLDVEIVTEMLQSGSRGQIHVDNVDTMARAFKKLKQENYSALILDLNLPDHRGTRRISELVEEFPTLPIVILTGLDDQEQAVKCLHMGVQDYVSKNQINSELLRRIMRYAVERKEIDLKLKQALEEADHKNRQLTKLARTDNLTKLPNRAYFFEVTSQAISMATRLDKALGILYFDLNGFKFVNDNFGHSVGDQVLIEIAKRMKNRLRNGDTVARVGGDEFVVLTNMLQEPVQAYSVAKKVNEIICEPIQIDGNEFNITVSIGISTFPEVTDVDKLVQCADMAMYEAKASKQHFACFYTKHLENKYQKQKLMEDALDSAINNKELSATFQPILSRNDDQGLAVEALCRWRSGSLGTVATEQFIPIAESSKLGDRLGSFMLEQCAQLKKVCDARGIKLNKICINIFARQFTDKQFARRLLKEADELGLAHHHLCVEITERQMIENIEVCQVQLATLKLHGVQVALDDFGTGFSSITHLKNLPIDFLKLDRSLIAHVDTTEDNQAICDGIIHMAHRLKIKVTAEGIERIEEYQTLAEMGCDEFQGHLLGYPMAEMDLLNHWHKSQLKMLPGHKGEDHNESRPTH